MHLLRVLTLLFLCTGLFAHNMPVAVVHILFKQDGTYTITLHFDVDSLSSQILPDDPELLDLFIVYSRARMNNDAEREIEAIAYKIMDQTRLSFDGSITKPQFQSLDLGEPDSPQRQQTATLTGKTLSGKTRCRWLGHPYLPIINLQIESSAVPGTYVEIIQNHNDSQVYAGVPSSRIDVGSAYFVNGILHIVPLGFDHILFILGLFFVVHNRASLLWQVSAFTLAHSITLAMCSSGWSPPQWLGVAIEPLIALSIAFVGFENCFSEKMHKWRPAIVFLFGLIHGMGFASVLSDIGLPDRFFWVALLSFNVGIEIAQLCILGVTGLLLWSFMKKPWYRRAIVLPSCAIIGICGLYMLVLRLMQ